jgi:signal transduction histidine kinase
MIWNSMTAMGVFDIYFIVVTVIIIYFLAVNAKAVAFVGARVELRLLVAGLVIFSSLYFFDLVLMIFGPMLGSDEQTMMAMQDLHLNYRWVIDAVAIGLMMIGLVGLIRHFSRMVDIMRSNRETLKVELTSQSSVQDDLKKKASAARESSRSKTEFLLGLSHELRTPLNGIIGLTGLLSNTELGDDQRKLLTTLEQSAQAMLVRVNDVLDLSKLETGQVQLRAVLFRPIDLVQAVEALFAPLAAKKGLTLSCHGSEWARLNVIGDHALIKQILCNLVSNAIKFTPAGTINLVVDVREADDGRLALSFSVIDTGVGMPPDQVERLSRPVPVGSESTGEVGLGLSISWRLAELMDGKISIESELHKGSAVTVSLQVQAEPSIEDDALVADTG